MPGIVMATNACWKFWIDVGGTFTDCLASGPQGQEAVLKVLSSGMTKGGTIEWISPMEFKDSDRMESAGFWVGAAVRLLDEVGEVVFSSAVVEFAEGRFVLADGVPHQGFHSYEIDGKCHAPLLAIHLVLDHPLRSQLPSVDIQLGTTRGTNALLTRTGARTAFVTTRGFRDLLAIGDQTRPRLFERDVVRPVPLCDGVFEVDERILADGTVEKTIDRGEVVQLMERLSDEGYESVAIALIHSFRFPQHEQEIAEVARQFPFADVSCSSDVAPLIKLLPRAETVTLDAYLNPVLQLYLQEIAEKLTSESQLELMTSNGGLVSRENFSGKDSVLSGPAGGVVGAVRIAEQLGIQNVVGFDMGGTSTDVCRYSGEFEMDFEAVKAGVRLATPTLSIETVASGGGSICWFDGSRLRVGPQSATSEPGPACYGRGGPLTITDVNLFLGRIVPDFFPFSLSPDKVIERLKEIQEQLSASGTRLSLDAIADGFLKIANQHMATAIRNVSVARGYDPTEYTMVSFGGAGSQHCCAVAEILGIRQIIDHPESSILSAVGIRLADRKAEALASCLVPLSEESVAAARLQLQDMQREVCAALVSNPVDTGCDLTTQYEFNLRYLGTEPFLSVQGSTVEQLQEAFEQQHLERYGYVQQQPIELVSVRVVVALQKPRQVVSAEVDSETHPEPTRWLKEFGESEASGDLSENPMGVPLFEHGALVPGDHLIGPAVVVDRFKTTIVDRGWKAVMMPERQLRLTRDSENAPVDRPKAKRDVAANPIRLELFNRQFSSIAVQMGESLQRTSCSVNVKERLDFSCAIFTHDGDLVVNAPHIPVHLGAMSETVRATRHRNPGIREGDVIVTNNPFAGGSHLPDITVVQPVFVDGQLRFWVASRSHHSELGGIAPGSMPANATSLAQEGILLDNLKIVEQGKEYFELLEQQLSRGPYPSRSVAQNVADIQAQMASNRKGEMELKKLAEQHGFEVVDQYMRFMADAAEAKARQAIQSISDGCYRFVDSLDNGLTIRVFIEVDGDQMTIDFSGTDPVSRGNLNANRAIVQSAIMYVVRLLIDDDIPLNEGVMRPVDLVLPTCFLNPEPGATPEASPAVVGGNVETSQRIVDVLLGALGLCAASQGTMNNWLIGNDQFGYYETVGGGTGATVRGPGADAVHSHMTNTRLTDPEVLETRYPVILRQFAIRRGSGGRGRHRGGDGMIREFEFRAPLKLSLLTNRRRRPPWGLQGGMPGIPGSNLLKKDGKVVDLGFQTEISVAAGDQLSLQTPGGGGYGRPR